MSNFGTTDFLAEVSKGNITGQDAAIIEGLNPDIDIASGEEDLWPEGGSLVYLSTAETMNIVSTSTDDDVGGTGVTSIFMTGLDANGDAISELVIMDGTSNVLTVNSYLRVGVLFAAGAGSGLTNAGAITATASSAGDVQANMMIGAGTSVGGFFTIPTGKSAIIKQIEINAAKITGGGNSLPVVNFKVYARFSGANQPWIVILERRLDTGVQDQLIIPFPLSNGLIAGADVRMTATTDIDNTEARMRATLLVYDS